MKVISNTVYDIGIFLNKEQAKVLIGILRGEGMDGWSFVEKRVAGKLIKSMKDALL